MSLFRRKPKKFNYAAIRIGNVYVLPPDEEDVREYRRERRKEITRRGFIVGGVLVALGAVALPFLPGKKNELDPEKLLDLDLATANKAVIRSLCLASYKHPNVEIRRQCAYALILFPGDQDMKRVVWDMIRNDSDEDIRKTALHALIEQHDHGDIPAILQLYLEHPSWQQLVREAADDSGFVELSNQIRAVANH